jgi:hypothetical protein
MPLGNLKTSATSTVTIGPVGRLTYESKLFTSRTLPILLRNGSEVSDIVELEVDIRELNLDGMCQGLFPSLSHCIKVCLPLEEPKREIPSLY